MRTVFFIGRTKMKVTIAEAANLTGKGISTLHRHTKQGKLSFSKNGDGEKIVDVAELERAYGQLKDPRGETQESNNQDPQSEHDNLILRQERDNLKTQVAELKEQVREEKAEKTKLLELADRLQRQNETLMLSPPKAPRSGNVFAYFRNLFTPTPAHNRTPRNDVD